MAASLPRTTSHVRSASWPSTSQLVNSSTIAEILLRLNASKVESSSSTSSISQNLREIKGLYENINNSIQCPLSQQVLSLEQHKCDVEEVLDKSLGLLDVCGLVVDVLSMMKESILELELSIRRSKSGTNYNDKDIVDAYFMSRKKIHKLANKCIKNLNLEKDVKISNDIPILRILRQAEVASLSTLKSMLVYLSKPPKGSGWSFANLMHSKRQGDHVNEIEKIDQALLSLDGKNSSIDKQTTQDLLRQLAKLELGIQEIEECLGSFSRCLLKARVSLLNMLSQ